MVTGWERLAALEGGPVSWLAMAPAADGTRHSFAATPVGVFRSTDLGLTWSPLGGASRVAGAEVVAASPRYAEDGTVFAGAYDGLYRWHEGGTVWEHLLSGSRVLSVAVAPGDPAAPADGSGLTVLAGTETDGVLISRDGGRTWEGANAGLLDLEILALAASPAFAEDGLAFAATPTTLYRTRNGAESWREIELDWDDVAIQCLAVSPDFAEDRVVLAGTEDHGLLRSEDAGRSWEQAAELADRMVNSLSFLADGRVVAGTDAGVGLSDDGGQSWRVVGEGLGGVGGAVLVGDAEAITLLAGLPESGAPRVPGLPHTGIARSVDDGRSWAASNRGLIANVFVGLSFSPGFADDQTLFVTDPDDRVRVSRDAGLTWAAAERAPEVDAAVEPLSVPYEQAEIVALARSPEYARDGTAFVATVGPSRQPASVGPVLWRTTDRGRRWDRWLELPDVPGGTAIRVVAPPPNRWNDTVLLGLGAQVMRPSPNAWENKGGARRPVWDAADLPGQDAVGRRPAITGLAASPDYARDRTLFAATSAGVYVSRDGGATFTAWNDGLETTAVVAVAPAPAYARDRLLYALGLGGTIWRRRDA